MKSRKDQTVAVAYPYPSQISARFHHSLLNLVARDAVTTRRLHGFIANSSGANITNARNEIVEAFLKSEADYLWFIDTDMVFNLDVVEQLVASAHPVDRPIVGGLCFSLQKGMHTRPTIYVIRGDGQIGVQWDYPPDQLVEVDATGTGCLLIHRSVFEKMRGEYPDAYPWFMESALKVTPVGEDITFCIRAKTQGFKVFVDTSIKVGHEKTFVVDESVYLAQRQANRLEPAQEPVVAVIASKDRRDMLTELLGTLDADAVIVFDNGYDPPFTSTDPRHTVIEAHGWGLHRMWNTGLDAAEKLAADSGAKAWNVAVLNDDLRLQPGTLTRLAHGLHGDDRSWIAYPSNNVTEGQWQQLENTAYAGQTMTGWCFMVRGETGLRFDEQFEWWYGDSDLEKQVRDQGNFVVGVGGCHVEHLSPMRSTLDNPDRLQQARDDEKRFAAKWELDPDTLWLAVNQ